MTRFAKIFVVFVTAASLGFAAFALAMFAGGPNWDAWANAPAVADHVSIVRSETGTYSATVRTTGEQLGSSENQADIVLKAQARVLADARAKLQDVQDRITRLSPQKAVVADSIAADRAGLDKHAAIWSAELQALATQIATVTDNLTQTGAQAQQLQEQLKELRFEVLRTRNQLELLRDDQYVSELQKQALEDELLLLQENRKRLERRQAGLKAQLEGTSY